MQGSGDPSGVSGSLGLGELMNESSNDGSEATDPTEGILADLANLQQTANANDNSHDVDESIREKLDHIAEAAESLRLPEAEDGDEEEGEDDQEIAPSPRSQTARAGTAGPKSAREAVANRGLVFEEFIRGSSDEQNPGNGSTSDGSASEQTDAEPAPQQAASAFDPRNPFAAPAPAPAAPAASEPRETPTVPHDGGLIFQVPKAELAEVVEADDDDDSDEGWDDTRDSAGGSGDSTRDDQDDDDDDSGNHHRRRRGGRGRRSRSREDSGDQSTSEDASKSNDSSGSDVDSPGDEDARSSRRRSRNGNKRSKPNQQSDSNTSDAHSTSDESAIPQQENHENNDDDSENGSRRRRRRRSRSTRSTDRDEVTSLKGSTRLEAKRQRRKEGREAGRRRPIITEAEFLARRESVERTMLVRESGDQTQLVVVEDGIAVEHYLKENRQQSSLIGNVYLGKVQNVLPSMEAAFIDIGKGRNAVLYAGEVNWDALGMDGKARRIETALSPGDPVLVQVTKDPIGHKGARLTSQISLPGRFLVYVPGNSMTGISRKLPDNERARLKKLLKELVGDSNGVIVRTAAEGATDADLSSDVERLAKRWETIEKKSKSTKVLAPQLLYSEPDMIVRIIRDVFNEDFNSLVIDGDGAWNTIHEYVESVASDLLDRVHSYSEDEDIFAHYRIEEQIQKALQRTVNLPSGGSLVIDRTEAMTVVDVNTGKFTGSGGNLEETVTRNNLEAAEEVIRQVRLRDIGGIIVVDFIDMVLESNRDLVVRRLVECLGRDRTKHQVAEVTSLGLVQMTRKRIGTGLAESMVSAGADLTGRGLLLPGSDEDGSRSHRGSRSTKSDVRRDRKRRNDNSGNNGKSAQGETEPHDETLSSDESRSAVAAIAKATLKKDEQDQDGDKAYPDDSSDSSSGRSRSRSGRRRSNKDSGGSEGGAGDKAASDEKSASGAEDRSESETSEDKSGRKAPMPAEPADLPLMIGAESETRVAKAEPAKRTPRKRSAAKSESKSEPVQEQLPTSFVIIGED